MDILVFFLQKKNYIFDALFDKIPGKFGIFSHPVSNIHYSLSTTNN